MVRMTVSIATDPVLIRLRDALDRMYGDRLERVVLYGSRARGDAREDSDYDVAVFLRDMTSVWRELDQIVPVLMDIMDETGAMIDAKPYRAGAYNDRTPLMREIRYEGIDL
jgi:predicted nucleotidyltransferase